MKKSGSTLIEVIIALTITVNVFISVLAILTSSIDNNQDTTAYNSIFDKMYENILGFAKEDYTGDSYTATDLTSEKPETENLYVYEVQTKTSLSNQVNSEGDTNNLGLLVKKEANYILRDQLSSPINSISIIDTKLREIDYTDIEVDEISFEALGYERNLRIKMINMYSATKTDVTEDESNHWGSVSGWENISYGTLPTLVATPNFGYEFIGFYKNNILLSNNATYTFSEPVKNNIEIEARFGIK